MSAVVSTSELRRCRDSEESLLLDSTIGTEDCQRMETSMICALPDHLLLEILYHLLYKDAIVTSILSKRWRYVWAMLPILYFKDEGISKNIHKLQLYKAAKLYSLTVKLSPHYHVDVDVAECVENAVNRGVKYLDFKLLCGTEPTRLPKSLYTCETLVDLTLSNQILVDVPSPAHLPSLLSLTLDYVVYKYEDSLDRLLSSSDVLECLTVNRHESDNLKTFMVKVSSLGTLHYESIQRKDKIEEEDEVDDSEEDEEDEVDDGEEEEEDEVEDGEEDEVDENDIIESLVIDSPGLRELYLWNFREEYCLIENMICLDEAHISFVSNPDVKFLRSLSSVIYLKLFLTKSLVACCYNIKFSRLTQFRFSPDSLVDWLEPLMLFLQNSPKLNTLMIYDLFGGPSPSWNQPSIIPECLSNHLEVFRWKNYEGREGEKQLLTYILANSKCLKTVEISFIATCNVEETRTEIESMPRIAISSRLHFSSSDEFLTE